MRRNKNIIRLPALLIMAVAVLSVSSEATAAPAAGTIAESRHFDLLPSNTFGVLHIKDLPGIISDLQDTPFYKGLLEFVRSDEFERLKTENKELAILEEVVFSLLGRAPGALTGEVTVAFIGLNTDSGEPEIIIIADADEKEFRKVVEDVIAPAIEKLGGPEIVIQKSGSLNRIGLEEDDEGVFFRTDGKRMVIALSEKTLDLIEQVEDPLSGNKLFTSSLKTQRKSADTFVFVNLREILEFRRKLMGGHHGMDPTGLRLLGLGTIESIAASSSFLKKGGVNELAVYAPDGLTGFPGLLSGRGSGPSIEKYVPEDYSLFLRFSVNSFQGLLKSIIGVLEEELGEDEFAIDEFNEFLDDIGDELGFSIEEDLLEGLGGEIGLAAKAPKLPGIPEAAIFIEVKDKAKLRKLIDDLTWEQVLLTESEYKGVEIKSTVLPMVQPCYAFIDNYLVIADSPGVIHDIIDTRENGKSLLNKKDYQTVFERLPEKTFLSLYIDTRAVFDVVLPVIATAFPDVGQSIFSGEPVPSETKALMTLLTMVQKSLHEVPGYGLTLRANKSSVRLRDFSGLGTARMAAPFAIIPLAKYSSSARRRRMEERWEREEEEWDTEEMEEPNESLELREERDDEDSKELDEEEWDEEEEEEEEELEEEEWEEE